MDSPETQATFGTRQRTKTNKAKNNTTQKTKKIRNTDITKKQGCSLIYNDFSIIT